MQNRAAKKSWAILSLLMLLGTLVVNGLANAMPINNKTTGQLSDQYPNLFVPAGVTFSVWALIYLLLAMFVVYQLICAFGRDPGNSGFISRVSGLFALSCVANMTWILAWHHEKVGLSLGIMLVLLMSLIAIYQRLEVGLNDAPRILRYLVHLPFSVYLGWISVATIANATAWLVAVKWGRFGLSREFWTVVVIVVAIWLAWTMLMRRKDIYYCLVVDWALLGIVLKRTHADAMPYPSIVLTAYLGMCLISYGILRRTIRKQAY